MSAATTTDTQSTIVQPKAIAGPPKIKKLKPARKQVKPGDVEKKEAPQTGKEYSPYLHPSSTLSRPSRYI